YSVSMQEASTALETLIPTVQDIRSSSRDVSRRLAALEQTVHYLPMNEMKRISHGDNKQISEVGTRADNSQAQASRGGLSETQDHTAFPNATAIGQALPHSLERLLQCSGPYLRLRPGFQRLAPSSASGRTGLNTVTTALSLSAVSNLSLVSLPISIQEIWNTGHYTATKDPPLLSSPLEYQRRAPSRCREPSPPSGFDQDNDSSSTSSETLTSRGSYGLSDSDHVNTLFSRQELDIPEPRRKIVFHGILNALLSRQELDIPKPRRKIVFHGMFDLNTADFLGYYSLTTFGLQGTNESGMSTLIKQMQIFYAPESINATILEDVRFGLWFNLVTAFTITLKEIADIDDNFESNEAEESANYFRHNHISSNDGPQWFRQGSDCHEASDSPLPPMKIQDLPVPQILLPSMETLWWDRTFQRTLDRGNKYAQYDNIF
ncbi:MAG: hypothetical protein Q9198_007107, partial [Flavoplaca austrocitrina]